VSDEAVDLVQETFKAYEARDWERVVDLTHPDSMSQVHQSILEDAGRWRIMPPPEEMHPPDTHPAVLEYFGQMQARFEKHGNPVLREMGVNTGEELAALSPRDSLLRFLQAKYIAPDRYFDGRGPVRTRRALGAVHESENVAHVVYRLHTDMGTLGADDELYVVSVHRRRGEWRVVLNAELSHRQGGSLVAITDE